MIVLFWNSNSLIYTRCLLYLIYGCVIYTGLWVHLGIPADGLLGHVDAQNVGGSSRSTLLVLQQVVHWAIGEFAGKVPLALGLLVAGLELLVLMLAGDLVKFHNIYSSRLQWFSQSLFSSFTNTTFM